MNNPAKPPARLRIDPLLGESAPIRRIIDLINKIKGTDATVLIQGESGTGKELVARAIHLRGHRRREPFVPVNCSAIPETLIEAELFGTIRGAATGVAERPGKFETANRGTVFLDEIGDLSPFAQPKVLRVLQELKIFRVGGTTPIPTDVRIICATNKDLSGLINEGQFREDLYFRINVFPIQLPALRHRRSDIPLLMDYFVRKICRMLQKKILLIPQRTVDSYQTQYWPGNVRELHNVIEREIILTDGTELPSLIAAAGVPHISFSSDDFSYSGKVKSEEEIKRYYARKILKIVGGNKAQACKLLKIDFKTLQKRIGRHEVRGMKQES